jgi:hypothetical protein
VAGSPSIDSDNHRQLTDDRAIAGVAGRQEGRIASWQLHSIGVSTDDIDYRCRVGQLESVAYGTYAVGWRSETLDAQRWDAVLRAGPGAVLAGGAALVKWGCVQTSQRIEVIAPRRVRRKGLLAREIVLEADEKTECKGMPVSTVARALLDVAATWKPAAVARALNEAEARQLYDHVGLVALVERYPTHPGAETIRGILADRDPAIVLSPWEDELHDWILEHFPRPRVNEWMYIDGRWVRPDFAFVDELAIVEADSRHHDTADQKDADDERDAFMQARGWAVVRVRKRRWRRDPNAVAAQIWDVLKRSQAPAAA